MLRTNKINYSLFIFLFCTQTFAASELTIVTEEYPPYNFTSQKDKIITGISVDIVAEMAKRAHLKISFEMYPWARSLQLTEFTPNTCIISAMKTAERENKLKWVGPIISDHLALFVTNDSKIVIQSIAEAKKYTIGTYLESATIPILQKYGMNYDAAHNDNLNPRKLINKRIDMWIGNSQTGPYIAGLEGVRVKKAYLFDEATDMYMACNKNMSDKTITHLNKTMKNIIEDGTLKKIENKYSYLSAQ